MLKNILEKIYLLLIIIAIGGYSAMSMLTIERESIYAAEDPLLFKLFVGLLFILTLIYIVINNRYLTTNRIKHLLFFITCYLAISKVAAFPPTAGMLSYFYHPIQVFLTMTLYAIGQIISAKSKDTLNFFSTYMFAALLIMAFFYYKNWSYANLTAEAHLGTSYYALFLLLPILFSSKKWIKLLAILITLLIIMSSFKRGGVVAIILGLVVYLFVQEILLEFKIRKLIWFIVLILGLLIFFICIDNYMGNIISERLLNITNDGGSGRDRVWETTWGMIRKSYTEYLLLGHGYSTVLTNSPLGLSAHNDFLEVLYNWGIVLFIPYVVMHIALIKQVFIFIRNKSIYAPTLAFSYTIFFILSMISIVILYPLMGLIALTWGITSNLQESTKI